MNEKAHDLAVAKVIDDVIAHINAKVGRAEQFTVAEMLELCRGFVVTQLRESGIPGASEDTVLRDAEYYFIGRMEVAEETSDAMRFIEANRWVLLNHGYNAAKTISNFFDSDIMRADAGKPNSPPGGLKWLKAGIADAWNDRGQEYGTVPPRGSLAAPQGPH